MKKRSPKTVAHKALALHKKQQGKIKIQAKAKVTRDALQLLYTPGVGAVSSYLHAHPDKTGEYTFKGNSVAIISDGSAVLGLGNIGPYAAYPVMEGKALIFKEFAGIDGVPIVLDTQDVDEIVRTIVAIAPTFGGINLEDIKAPQCFEVEKQLIEKLSMPVMHDDQHGTAIVVLAGLINAAKVVKKKLANLKVVIVGAGAAGIATARLLQAEGIMDIVLVDTKGVLHQKRTDLTGEKKKMAEVSNPRNVEGTLSDALLGADVCIGVSGPNLLSVPMIQSMAERAIVFALSNPVPEILPSDAKKSGAEVVATGRSDFPNQINNALVFPGIFKGALARKVTSITMDTKRRAAHALAKLVAKPTKERIVPDIMDKRVVSAVARAVR